MLIRKGGFNMRQINSFISFIFIFSTLAVFAQPELPQRTEELEKLNVFVGKWMAEGKVYPGKGRPLIQTKGKPTFQWVMHRSWLMYKSGKGRLMGHGYFTWDKQLGKYAFFWLDNLITKPTKYFGGWLDSQTLAVSGKLKLRGEIVYTKIKWQFIKKNEIKVVREVSSDGKRYRVAAELKYTR
jgi:hypothetical protein